MLLTRRRQVPVSTNNGLDSLARQLNRLVDDTFGAPFAPWDSTVTTSAWIPAVDVVEDDKAIRVVAELPGVKRDDVSVSFENNVLAIRGEKRQEREDTADRFHRYERSYGTFERHFSLPSTVDADHIEAAFDDGVLTVTLPKVERARPREIPVSTK